MRFFRNDGAALAQPGGGTRPAYVLVRRFHDEDRNLSSHQVVAGGAPRAVLHVWLEERAWAV